MGKITFLDKVENLGTTNEGKLFASEVNQIKTCVNDNYNLLIAKAPTSGSLVGSTLSIKNAANTTLFSVDLSSLASGGIYTHPEPTRTDGTDSSQTLTNGGVFSVVSSIISNIQGHITSVHTRQFTLPTISSGGGLVDAPIDGLIYARQSGAWVTITSGGGGITVHNDLTGRSTVDAHPISAITGLQGALDAKSTITAHADLSGRTALDSHPMAAITDLVDTLAGKAAKAGSALQDFTAKVLTVTSFILNGVEITIE